MKKKKKERKDSNREGGRLKRERRAREEQGGRTIKRMKIEKTERNVFKFSNPTLLCNISRSTNSLFYTILIYSSLYSSFIQFFYTALTYSSHIHSCVEELYISCIYQNSLESASRRASTERRKTKNNLFLFY